MSLKNRVSKHFAVAAVAAAAATSAHADIVHSGTVNHNIAASLNGLYINVVTGAINAGGGGGGTVAGWDLNFWSSTGFGMFSPGLPGGGAYVVNAGVGVNMSFGDTIDGSDTFGTGSSLTVSQWNLNSDENLVGFRFHNEDTAAVHYGWARIGFGASITDRWLVEYAYESEAGVGIGAGIVPAPSAMALLGLGGLVAGRRRR